MRKRMDDIVPDMGHCKPVRIGLLPAGRAKTIICCEHGCTVQAVSWMHVTPLGLKYKLNISSLNFADSYKESIP